jgi:hypothetical protein
MALSESLIVSIESAIESLKSSGDPLLSGLRELFPDILFVRCDASDMDAPPFRASNRYQLYLMDRSEVCLRLTDRLEAADGVVIVEMN